MLVLTRNVGTSILIGDDIKITVLSVCGQYVRLGIDAPRDVLVSREELRLADNRHDLGGEGGCGS